jgi:serine/threonine-protein kinase
MSSHLINSSIGEYRIIDRLGEGGMGEVYRGVHNKIGRVAAVKILSTAVSNPEFIERFLNEARIQARLHHPNVAPLFDFLEFQGRPCIIMEFVEGQTLADLIRIRGALHQQEMVAIFRSIVEALDYVHSQGIIHRDIKSTNIKITPAGQVKLLDFGIAKSGNSPALTVTGGFVGTLQYISPEQFTGGNADARSDIWAAGVLLYEMSTGRLPFEANSVGCRSSSRTSRCSGRSGRE